MGDAPTTLHMPKEEEAEPAYCLDMPPGFRFHPTDAEIIWSYLLEKIKNHAFTSIAIGEIDINGCEPWDLPRRAKMGEKEWWFFWRRDRKYPTGTRTNRATEAGYWKATGKDKEIYRGKGCLVGMKKTLVFYLGRAPKGRKTNWVMHEYRLEGSSLHAHISRASKNDWVVCRVFHKNEPKKNVEVDDQISMPGCFSPNGVGRFASSSTLPPLSDSSPPYADNNVGVPSSSFGPDLGTSTAAQWMMPSFLLDVPLVPAGNPIPTHYYNALPQFPPFREQGDVVYSLHHGGAATRDALKRKCKIEEQPLPSRSTVETGGRTWDDPGSPSVGPLASLDEYMWIN